MEETPWAAKMALGFTMVEPERSHDEFEWTKTRGQGLTLYPSSPETIGPLGCKQNPKGCCSSFHTQVREARKQG